MSQQSDLISSLRLFEKDFQLDKSYLNLEEQQGIAYNQAFLMIMRVVEDLMTKDFNRLINVLYRIDVSEDRLKEALALSNDNPASVITKMILDRQLQKVETRKKYSS
ncbi:hypothetical protein [Roseivirga sp. E12]|uniref:hypothetical protein n=1 Tax=Roseivirga sp. E12 TaxID=2819237 RepID=UPI001ABC7941|nr:hypothetical protein [Roseivirga sp. E12]MBO3698283.1 hypothetical protein [Roseivirga sp. E12]